MAIKLNFFDHNAGRNAAKDSMYYLIITCPLSDLHIYDVEKS